MSFGVGVSINRNRNVKTNLNHIALTQQEEIIMGFPDDMQGGLMGAFQYGIKNAKDSSSFTNTFNQSVLRIEGYVKDTRSYTLLDRKSSYQMDQNQNGKSTYHKIIMEMPMDNFFAKIQAQGLGGIYKLSLQTNRGKNSKQEHSVYLDTIKDLFMPEEYEFFISDVDDFMNGNPYGKNVTYG